MEIPIQDGKSDDNNLVPVTIIKGQSEMRALLDSVIEALSHCEMDVEDVRYVLQALHDRMANVHGKIFQDERISDNVIRRNYNPMVELVLIEVREIAGAKGWTGRMRKERIDELLGMAGF